MRPDTRIITVLFAMITALGAAEQKPQDQKSKKDDVVKLPPVIVEESQPKVKPAGPSWKEELMAPGAIWRLDDAKLSETFLFDRDHLARTIFGTKAVMRADGTITAGFNPARLTWHLEDEWLVFVDRKGHRIEELRFIHDGLIWLTAARRSGEVLKFRVRNPPPTKPPVVKQ